MPRFIPCAGCGERIQHAKTSLPPGQATCRPCRRAVNGPYQGTCGTVGKYRRGCRCQDCRAAHAAKVREYAARRRAEGFDFHQYRSTPTRSDWIRPADRLALYERDNWTCQICSEPVDPNLPRTDRMSATLDHIMPRSLVLIPDHRPENSIRGNRVEVA